MKALRLHGADDLKLHEEPVPVAGPGRSLLRIAAVGICGSDLHWFSDAAIGDATLSRPLILGHEFSAVVQEGDLAGQLVAVEPAINCGVCEYCLEGNPNFCLETHFAGHADQDGALREFVDWPSHLLFPVPESFSPAEAAMLEPLGVALHSQDLSRLKPGWDVAVLGCGPIGLLIVQLARRAGSGRVIATDPLGHRLEAALKMGAHDAIEARGGDEAASILKLTGGRGVDLVFEVAGENAAVDTAVEIARPGAAIMLIGIPADDRCAFSSSVARRKGLTLRLIRRMKHTYPRAIRLVEQGDIDVGSVVSHQFDFNDSLEAFQMAARRKGLKIVICPDQ